MKRVAISVLVLLICICFAVFNCISMQNLSKSMQRRLDLCYEKYGADKSGAIAEYERFFKNFEGAETYLCISLNHEEIDILREAVAKTYLYLKSGEDAEFQAEYFALYRLIEHMGELERISVGNLL